MKKLLSIILAIVMVMSISVTALAADDQSNQNGHTITIKNEKPGHVYGAFCIFKGDLNSDETVLSDIQWGGGVNGDALLLALQAFVDDKGTDTTEDDEKPFEGCNSAASVAGVLAGYKSEDHSAVLNEIAQLINGHLATYTTSEESGTAPDCVYTIGELDAGYYLVKDTGSYNGAEEDAATRLILEVVADVEVTAKDGTITSDKEIRKANGETFDLVRQDDYNVGDVIDFQITGDIPAMDGYTTYEYIVHDTMSAGITPVDADKDGNIDVTVSIVTLDANGKVTETYETLAAADYTFETAASEETFVLSINDFISYKGHAGKKVLVTYSGILNENALTTAVETNKSYIEFSNDPNRNSKGKTVTTEVHVFDFDINIDKYTLEPAAEEGNTTNKKLAGAKFVLYKLVTVETGEEAQTTAAFYCWNETTKGVEWVSAIDYTHDAEGNNKANDAVLAAVAGKTITEKTTDGNGAAKFAGLDTGTYYLLETDAPDGYNTLADVVKVEISATYNADGTIDSENTSIIIPEVNAESQQPYVEQPIENKAGTLLPTTGGIGTTIFYVVGCVMMFGAAVMLIAKRRADVE